MEPLTPRERADLAAQTLVGALLHYDQAEIPPDHLAWLKNFARGHMTREEWDLVAEAFHWEAADSSKGTKDTHAETLASMGLSEARRDFGLPTRPKPK